jgi:hypothetical protein
MYKFDVRIGHKRNSSCNAKVINFNIAKTIVNTCILKFVYMSASNNYI